MTEWFAGLCPYCLSGIGEHKLATPRWSNVIRCGKCKKETTPIVAVRLLNEINYAGLEMLKDSDVVINQKGNKISMKLIGEHYDIVPKKPYSRKLVKAGIDAIDACVQKLDASIKNNTGIEVDAAMLRQIIACCYKNGMKSGEIAFHKIKADNLGKEIVIFNSFMSGEGNSFITLGDMETRSHHVLPGLPLKLFGTIRSAPSILLFFGYFSALHDPDYSMSQNKAILFY